MGLSDSWAALHLEKPPRVPRTEYSVLGHWELLREVTGLPITLDSTHETKLRAQKADFTPFIDDIAATGVHGFFLEPLTDMRRIAEKYGRTHVFVGNADTRILLEGSREQIRAEVERCIAIGKECPGFIMAVGNHIPANTPVENALYYNQIFEELRER